MARCVVLTGDGRLVDTNQAVSECTGYVLVSGSEYGVYQLVNQAFSTPSPQQAAGWFVGSAGVVMFWFVVARMAGSVAAMFDR